MPFLSTHWLHVPIHYGIRAIDFCKLSRDDKAEFLTVLLFLLVRKYEIYLYFKCYINTHETVILGVPFRIE